MAAIRSQNRDAIRQHMLVIRCQTGDESAFRELYERFSGRTLRYLQNLVGSQTADDVHQEVWVTVYRKIGGLTNPKGFKTWLYQLVRHRAIDYFRKEQRESELFSPIEDELFETEAQREEGSPLPENSEHLQAAMAGLSVSHRDVLMLRFWEDLSYAEIGLVVGCSIGTVRSRLHHSKLKIEESLRREL